jgi:hypothetical protein
LDRGELKDIITQSVEEVGLPAEDNELIPTKTNRSRVYRNNYGIAGSFSSTTPMHEIEPLLVEFCRDLNRMAKSINHHEFLALANDIILDTRTSDRVKEFHKCICGATDKEKWLCKKYFYNLMSRHQGIIHHAKEQKCCVNRLTWAAYPQHPKNVYLGIQRNGSIGSCNKA